MKKIIFILSFIILATINTNAQDIENVWLKYNLEGDELLERETDVVYSLTTIDGDKIVHYTTRPNMVVIASDNGIFDFKRGRYTNLSSAIAVIGYYDLEGNLIDKETETFFKLGNNYDSGFLGSKKLMKYLREGNGYVRFVISRYSKKDLDATIPTWKICPPKPVEDIIDKLSETKTETE